MWRNLKLLTSDMLVLLLTIINCNFVVMATGEGTYGVYVDTYLLESSVFFLSGV
jgi:hypothetical protein